MKTTNGKPNTVINVKPNQLIALKLVCWFESIDTINIRNVLYIMRISRMAIGIHVMLCLKPKYHDYLILRYMSIVHSCSRCSEEKVNTAILLNSCKVSIRKIVTISWLTNKLYNNTIALFLTNSPIILSLPFKKRLSIY